MNDFPRAGGRSNQFIGGIIGAVFLVFHLLGPLGFVGPAFLLGRDQSDPVFPARKIVRQCRINGKAMSRAREFLVSRGIRQDRESVDSSRGNPQPGPL